MIRYYGTWSHNLIYTPYWTKAMAQIEGTGIVFYCCCVVFALTVFLVVVIVVLMLTF